MFAFSCGTAKNTADNTAPSISKTDHQYIALFHEGVRQKIKGQTTEAIETFEKCLSIKQDDDGVYFALSELEYTQKNYSLSGEYVKKAYEIDPTNSRYIQDVAYLYYEAKDFENASIYFEKLADIDPHNVDWVYGYAQSLVQNKEYKKAVVVLDNMETVIGVNSQLSIQKYYLYTELKKPDLALNEIEEARKVFPDDADLIGVLVDYYIENDQENEAIKMLEDLVRVSPENHSAQLALADFYYTKGDEDVAFNHLKLAFKSKEMKLDDKMKILIDLMERSGDSFDENSFQLAKEMVELYPEDAKSHSIYADFLLQKGDKESALKEYKKALEYDNAKFPIWNQVLMMEYQMSDFDALYVDSKECLTIFPSITSVYLLNGVSANRLKKYDDAIDALSTGKEMIVDDNGLKAEFYGQLGDSYFGLKELQQGKNSYVKALELDQSSSLLRNNYSIQLAKAKINLDKAKEMMEEILTSSPNNPVFIDTYGFILFQNKEYKDAMHQFEDALVIDPTDVVIMEHLGDAHALLGKEIIAIDWWKKAKEQGAENPILNKKIEDKKYYEE